jgi:hypothetical protein
MAESLAEARSEVDANHGNDVDLTGEIKKLEAESTVVVPKLEGSDSD